MADKVDITVDQGADFQLHLTVQDSEGAVVDLTGASARMMARPSVESDTVIVSCTVGNGRVTVDEPNGVIEINISATDTASITRSGVYDVEVIYADLTVDRLVQGRFILDKNVTR